MTDGELTKVQKDAFLMNYDAAINAINEEKKIASSKIIPEVKEPSAATDSGKVTP